MSKDTLEAGRSHFFIKRLGNHEVVSAHCLGDGFVAYMMSVFPEGHTSISGSHFQASVIDVFADLIENDLQPVPREALDIIEEKLLVRSRTIPFVDMVIPMRVPPDRGNYLKYNPRRQCYYKDHLVINRLHVEGEHFIVIAMDPGWEPGI